uniref:WGS project CAEQ00000000 data, annotated contig 693 n=1 Tax=Trypanosoma congolense (strain IL3000) TaxID=1068625 RepID=F9WHT0_TRYCI|nr:unnamed protein product [Trypanosoma congolense IL3000]
MGPKRAFVFITNIPDYLLEPLVLTASSRNNNRLRASRDPRYERLRSFLNTNTSGVMHVMHLETRGYALALYASEEEALGACKTTIIPKQQSREYPPLLLRVLEKPRPAPLQSVYTPTVVIEGETVLKEELADTRGLELVYRGRAVARWCSSTLSQQDCPFGTSCSWVHKRAYQRTVRKRPRIESGDQHQQHSMTAEERGLVDRITNNTRCAEEYIVPPEMKLEFSIFVSVTREESLALVGTGAPDESRGVVDAVVQRVEAACAAHPGPYFVKFAFPGGAPWDWSLYDEERGLRELRRRTPFPPNGAPTSLERDIFTQQLLYHMNQMNRFETIASAIHALSTSHRARQALHRQLEKGHCGNAGKDDADVEGEEASLELCVRPWLFLPTVGVEATIFIESGGELLRGIVQRRGAVRLMTSYALLHQKAHDTLKAAFTRFAILGSGDDVEAESCLEAEIHKLSTLLKRAAQRLQHFIRRQQQHAKLAPGASWSVQVAVSPPPDDVAQSEQAAARQEGVEDPVSKCVVLSLQEYQTSLEEHTALHGEVRGGGIMWNTKKHGYIPLIPREVMEQLSESRETQEH